MNENFHIEISEDGAREVQRNIEGIGTSARKAEKPVNDLKRLLGAYVSLQALRDLSRTVDAFTEMENRIKVLDSVNGNYNETLQRLGQISLQTRSRLQDNVLLFQRMGLAQKELGATTEDLFKATTIVGQAIAVQGGLATTSAGAVLQLSQAFGSGRVQLEEFNSVITGLYPVALAAAKGIDGAGGSIARLRNMIKEGDVNSTMLFQGILKGGADIEAQFKKTVPTIQQSFTVLETSWTLYIGQLNKSLGASVLFSETIMGIANNLDEVARYAIVAAAALGPAMLLGALQKVASLITAFALLNPFAVFVSAIAAALTYLALFNDDLEEMKNNTFAAASVVDRLGAAWVGTLAYIKAAWANFPDWLETITAQAVIKSTDILGAFGQKAASMLSQDLTDIRKIGDAIGLGDSTLFKNMMGSADSLPGKLAEALQGITVSPELQAIADRGGKEYGSAFAEAYIAYLKDAKERTAAQTSGLFGDEKGIPAVQAEEMSKRMKRLTELRQQVIDKLDTEAQGLQMESDARERLNDLLGIEQRLKEAMQPGDREMFERKLKLNQELQREADIYDEITGPLTTYKQSMEALSNLLQRYPELQEKITEKMRDTRLEFLAVDQSIAGGLERGILNLQKGFGDLGSIAEDQLTNGIKTAEDALVQFVSKGKVEFSSLVDSIIADIARMAIQNSITKPLVGALGNFLGSLGGGAAPAGVIPGVDWTYPGRRAEGGPVSAGSMYEVNERGAPELLSVGDKQYLMMAGRNGQVSPVGSGGGGRGGKAVILQPVINNYASDKVTTRTEISQDSEGNMSMAVFIDGIEKDLAGRVSTGRSPLLSAMGQGLGIQPRPRGG